MEHANDNDLPRTRAEARRTGAQYYYTGKPCKNGHLSKRYAEPGHCKDCLRERQKKYADADPEKNRNKKREYRAKNINAVRAYEREKSSKRYRADPSGRRAYNKMWREKNSEKERLRSREKYYRIMRENPEQIRAAGRRSDEKKRSTAKGRLENSIRAGVHRGLVKGGKMGRSTFKLLGYSLNQLMRHLEKRFQPDMTWENYGEGWHVDHIIPLAAHNYETVDDIDFNKAWSLKNLQPLWGPDNNSKSDKLEKEFQPSLAIH